MMHPMSFKDLHTELLNIEGARNRLVVPYSYITCVANQGLIRHRYVCPRNTFNSMARKTPNCLYDFYGLYGLKATVTLSRFEAYVLLRFQVPRFALNLSGFAGC